MKIMFVRPAPSPETIGLQHVMLVEPLELEVLAALTEDDDEPVIVDMILEKKELEYFLDKHDPDMLCVTGYITNVPDMIDYCFRGKKHNPQMITVVGGVHVEVVPEDLDNLAVDYRVVRNPTVAFPALLSHLKRNTEFPAGVFRPKECVRKDELPDFNFTYPRPRRDLTAKYRSRYFYIFHERVALIKTAFGCPYHCNFCFCRMITDDHFHQRSLDDILDELESIEEDEIYIVDDDFLVSPARMTKFMDALEERGIKKHYLLYGRSDFIAKYPEIMERFAGLGLKTVIVGLESFKEDELEAFNKETDVQTNEEAMHVLNKYGIDCYATVIISPDWGDEDFDLLVNKLKELKIKYVNLQPLTPIPGTGFEVDESRLAIHPSEYAKWDLAHVTIRPEKMSVADFYMKIIKSYEKILYRPDVLISHAKNPPRMIWKMVKGTWLVRRQYMQKYREALKNA